MSERAAQSSPPPAHDPGAPPPAASARAAQVLGAGALTLAVLGFFAGTRQVAPRPLLAVVGGGLAEPAHDAQEALADGAAPRAVPYAGRPVTLGPNAGFASDLRAAAPARDPRADVPREPEAKAASLAARAARRAYMGAPPVVPHPVESRSAASCLACHERGLRLGAQVAPVLSHPPYQNCLQCHAPPAPSPLAAGPASGLESGFQGLPEPSAGPRAGPGSPPVIPHPTPMREDCTSCHGALGRPGLRTTHPERVNCRQCHAASSGFAR